PEARRTVAGAAARRPGAEIRQLEAQMTRCPSRRRGAAGTLRAVAARRMLPRPNRRSAYRRWEEAMKCIALAMGAVLMASTTALAQAPSWTVPPESARCPSKWGAGDERGSGNMMKPAVVLEAVKLIKTG